MRKPYSSYKDSGVEWIGMIPSHWNKIKTNLITENLDGKRIPLNSEQRSSMKGEIPYWGSNGVIDYINDYLFDEELVLVGEDGAPFFDIFKDVSFFINGKVWINNHIHILKVKSSVLPKYLMHSFNCVDYGEFINGSTRDKLTQSNLDKIPHLIPPISEQKQILDYLNHKAKLIDELIEKTKQKIELLKEKRTSLINHCVTKGLNPDLEMKDYNIGWIGRIPFSWRISKIRYITSIGYGNALKEEDRIEGNYNVYGSNGIVGNHNIPLTNGETIIIGRKGSFGKINLSQNSCYPIDTTFYIEKKNTENNIKWLFYGLIILGLDSFSKDSSVPGINREEIYERYLPLPPISEQQQIVEYLGEQTQKINTLIEKENKRIELLKEYRQSLISEAVTGKIDVRDEVAV